MKEIRALRVGKAASRLRQCQSKPATSSLPVIRVIIAIFVILTQCMILDSEAQTNLPSVHGSQATQTQTTSLASLAAQGRQHPSYQVFAGHLALPSITVTDETTLDVEGEMKMNVSRLDQLTRQQKETLAGRFEVPVGVVDKFQESFSNQAPLDAAQVAGKLRVTIIDYKYLTERWTQYLPPIGKEKVRSDALLALQAGDLDKAWGMFADLPRPKPPTGGRRVVQN